MGGLGSRSVRLDGLDSDLGLQSGRVVFSDSGHWFSSIFNAAHHLRKGLFFVRGRLPAVAAFYHSGMPA